MIYIAKSKLLTKVGYLVGDSRFDSEAAFRAIIKSIVLRRNRSLPSYKFDFLIHSFIQITNLVTSF